MTRHVLFVALAVSAGVAAGVVTHGQGRGPGRGRGAEVALPEGAGQAEVRTICSTCHALTNITNSRGYSRDGWDQLTSSMISLPAELKMPMMT